MPATYLTDDKADMAAFEKAFDPKKLYIAKRNQQNKEGLLLSSDLDELRKAGEAGYTLLQRYFRDEIFLLGGRKLNLRFYALITCDPVDGSKRAYVHRNGGCIYTNRKYDRQAAKADVETQITSVNLDPKVYDELPLEFDDLRKVFSAGGAALPPGMEGGGIDFDAKVMARLRAKMAKIMAATLPAVCTAEHLRSNTRYMLFGGDAILDEKLEPYVLELNLGPNMTPRTERGYTLKRDVLEDTLRMGGSMHMRAVKREQGFGEPLVAVDKHGKPLEGKLESGPRPHSHSRSGGFGR